MKRFYAFCLLVAVLSCSLIGHAQTERPELAQYLNGLLQTEKQHLPVSKFSLQVSKVAIEKGIVHIYFNEGQSYTKGGLPAEYTEMLPEILLPVVAKAGATNMMLLAKEKQTNEWKSLDYFADHQPNAVYKQPENLDTKYPAIAGKNTNTLSKVFPTPGSPTAYGALNGKTVWLSPGHGWHNTGSGYITQRGTTNEIVEDFTTIESIDYYLMGYLYNAGANVWSVRERDVNSNEVIVNNDVASSGYSETGTWTTGSSAGYGGTYRVATASATETATAIFVPNVAQSGLYWVSVRCIAGVNRATDVLYTIIHSGDTSKVKVNQEIHSDTWVYVGQFYFTAGGVNKVILSNQSTEASQAIIADAVRLGGGIGAEADCVNTGGGVSGRSRFEESARQYARFQGHPNCVEDVTVRPKYTEYELAKGSTTEISNAVYVAWHTNAGGGTGTESYIYDGLGSGRPNVTAGSLELRNYIHSQVVADIRAGWKATWSDRGTKVANFGELRELNTVPGTLIELAFHDLAADATDLKSPEFRRLAARAFYKGIVKFFNNRDGSPLIFLPEQPTNVVAKNIGNAQIQLDWSIPQTGGILGDAATGYKVYISTNGKSFKDGIPIVGTSYIFTGNPNSTYYFKITATNTGGESFASGIVAARTPVTGVTTVPYLIVDAFDRLDASALIPRVESAALGTVKRMFLDRMNRYDYMIEHATALASCSNMAFDGCQNEAVKANTVLLTNYLGVDWYTGEESTVDFSVDATERTLIKAYLNAGGSLLISGAEIGWDLGRAASANVDLDFFNNYLKATYVGDDANSYSFNGTTNFFASQTGTFDNSTNGYYDVDFPDRISGNGGSTIALNYNGGTGDGAAVGYSGTFKVLYMAFPFETITSASVRSALMCNAVAYLTPSVSLPIRGLTISGKNDNTYNTISFTTQAEIDTRYFVVERSDNGIMFYPISNNITPKGNSTTGASYTFIDNNILPTGYYRIKVVDKDGKMSFSPFVLLKAQKPNKLFNVISNPAIGQVRLTALTNESCTISLTNTVGQLVYSSQKLSGASNNINIDVSSLPKGMYCISMISGDKRQVEKVMVQ